MKNLQYPGLRLDQVKDASTRSAMMAMDGHVRSLYEFVNASISTDHGPGFLRTVAPIVIPEVSASPTTQSTPGRVGQLARRGPDVFMKTGMDTTDTDWIQLPTGSSGFADPTGVVGLSVVPGVATSYMRSDAAPPLSTNIQPIWQQPHEWQSYLQLDEMAAPGSPPANKARLYAKDKAGVSNLYFKRDDGSEVDLSGFGTVFGSGSSNKLARWTGAATLSTGVSEDDGTAFGVRDSGTGFIGEIDASQLSADQYYYLVDPSPGLNYLVTGFPFNAPNSVALWSSTGGIYDTAAFVFDDTQKQAVLGNAAIGTFPGVFMYGASAKTASMALNSSGLLQFDATTSGGSFKFTGNVSAGVPLVTVAGTLQVGSGIIQSDDVDGGGQPAFDFQAVRARTTDNLVRIQNTNSGLTMMLMSAYGESSFGMGSAPVTGNVLAFNISDSTGIPAAGNWTRGVSAIVINNTGAPSGNIVGVMGGISLTSGSATSTSAAGLAGVNKSTTDQNTFGGNTIAGVMGTFKNAVNTDPFAATGAGTAVVLASNWKRAASVYGDFFNMAVGATVPTNLPAIVCGLYGAIPALTRGEAWGLEIDNPNTGKLPTSGIPSPAIAISGAAKFPFPLHGTRQMHTYFVPFAITAGIKANSAHGDVVFDDGTNYTSGLWEYSKAAAGGALGWNYLLSSPGVVALGGGLPAVLGTIGGAGPAVAAQATWVQVNCADNVVRWVPAWV